MSRPREFDREVVLDRAVNVFWSKGYTATSTEELTKAMGIGRQSLYNAFGDKRQLYLEAIRCYQLRMTSVHLARLSTPVSPLAGIYDLLFGLVPEDDMIRRLGCMGVNAIVEFGTSDPDLVDIRVKGGPVLADRLITRIREGQLLGEIDHALDPGTTASFIQASMMGLQVVGRTGAAVEQLRDIACFTVNRLRAK